MDLNEATRRARTMVADCFASVYVGRTRTLTEEIAKELVRASADVQTTGISEEEEGAAVVVRECISRAYELGLRVEIREVDVSILDNQSRLSPEVRVWKEEEIR